MVTRKERLINRMFDALKYKAILNYNPGRILQKKYPKPNRKARKHSGRKYPKIFGPQKILDEEGIIVDYFWDDWIDYRDGFRDKSRLFKYPCCFYWEDHIENCKQLKAKIQKHTKIRKARKIISYF